MTTTHGQTLISQEENAILVDLYTDLIEARTASWRTYQGRAALMTAHIEDAAQQLEGLAS